MKILTNNDMIGMAQVLDVPAVTSLPHLEGLIEKSGSTFTENDTIIVSGSGLGAAADSLSRKNVVYGLTEWADEINQSIAKKITLAVMLGMEIPDYRIVDTMQEMDDLCANGYYPISKNVAIKRTHGLSITVEAFYNYGKFSNYFIRVSGDRLLYGNVGPMVPNALTCTFSMPNAALKPWFQKLAGIISERSPNYKGPVTITGHVFKDSCIYQDIHFGYNYDYELAKHCLCGLGSITNEAKIPKGYATTIRLYDIREEGLRLRGSGKYLFPLHCSADSEKQSIVSTGETPIVAVGLGEKIVTAYNNAYEEIKKVKTQELCYRPDGGRYAVEWWKKAKQAGIL